MNTTSHPHPRYGAVTRFVSVPDTGRTVNIAGYAAPVQELREVTEYRELGKLTACNLLLSGDNPHRDRARARFTIDTTTGLSH
ncbi:hypothetical protein P4U43_15010 [Arthrobacter sp. EH-1B-1]|uniref:Single-stranded DNA-binding protein n=1 Tax=Arthrobacter vasquezii TaxID=2977629 RepID=A0ABT6CYI2_9MICC|nr:hypothetical protein [Arthrobacter vasquezii]MDF9279097.1 hypothetical protein [Arthrobacter vasquezii]